MKEEYSILLLGYIYNNHTIRFVRNLKSVNPKVQIDCFGRKEDIDLPKDYLSCLRDFNVERFSNSLKLIPGLRTMELLYNWRRKFHDYVKGRHYDVAQIHYPEYMMSFIISDLRAVADNIVVTPWGSDVYRISNNKRRIVQRLYDNADFVTGAGDRFTQDFMRIFNVPDEKFAHADLGSETIDYISDHKDYLTTEIAKRNLDIEGYYTIGCGYNASEGQQHMKMIESIAKARNQLPEKLMLLFPVTYPKNTEYVKKLKSSVKESGLHAMWFDEFMDLPSLFELQMATDMFIHVQTTDANSTSLKEYILCGKNCVNGSWLEYDDIEEKGHKPFHVVEDLSNLDHAIVDAYQKGGPDVSQKVLQHIESLGCKPAAKGWNDLFMRISK